MVSLDWNSSLASALRQGPVQRLVPLVNLALVVALAFSLAQLTWLVWPAQASEKAPADQDNTRSVTLPAGQTRTTGTLANLHLFGEVQVAVAAPVVVAAPAPAPVVIPQTPLNLVLKGVVASRDVKDAHAIIAEATGKEDSYVVNAKLPGDAILVEIHEDHVILSRNGQNETLALLKDTQNPGMGAGAVPDFYTAALASGLPQAPSADIQQNPEFPADLMIPQETLAEIEAAAAIAQATDIGSTLRNYRDILVTNPQSLAGLAQAEPVQEGDKFMGFRVQPGSDPALFSGLGLQAGDIVTSVNGIVLDSPARAFEVMSAMGGANELQLVVNRGGQNINLGASLGP